MSICPTVDDCCSARPTAALSRRKMPFPRIRSVKAYVQKTGGANIANKQGSDCHDVPLDHWCVPLKNSAGARTAHR